VDRAAKRVLTLVEDSWRRSAMIEFRLLAAVKEDHADKDHDCSEDCGGDDDEFGA